MEQSRPRPRAWALPGPVHGALIWPSVCASMPPMIDLRPNPHGYDSRHALVLKGTGPLGEGMTIKISLGEVVVCGRSRHCGWSLKRTPAFLMSEDARREKLRRSLAWRATSRKHCRIAFLAPDLVEVVNFSTNGTFVDGHRVDRAMLTECRTRVHGIQLGLNGVTLELHPGSLPELPPSRIEQRDTTTS